MTTARSDTGRTPAQHRAASSSAPLFWGAAGAAAAALGAAAFNTVKARQAEATNPPLGRFIEIDGVQLHYLEKGTGPLVVLLTATAP